MKPLNRWNNALARRSVLVIGFPGILLVIIIAGAWLGVTEIISNLRGAVREVWSGPYKPSA